MVEKLYWAYYFHLKLSPTIDDFQPANKIKKHHTKLQLEQTIDSTTLFSTFYRLKMLLEQFSRSWDYLSLEIVLSLDCSTKMCHWINPSNDWQRHGQRILRDHAEIYVNTEYLINKNEVLTQNRRWICSGISWNLALNSPSEFSWPLKLATAPVAKSAVVKILKFIFRFLW